MSPLAPHARAGAPVGLLAMSLSLMVGACGEVESTTTDAGATDGGASDVTRSEASTSDAATDLFPPDTQKVVVTAKGGFVPPSPAGSECSLSDTTYTLLLPAREVSWRICEPSPGAGPSLYVKGTTTLTEAEYAPLEAALHALRPTEDKQCGADKPEEEITFTTPAGETVYRDAFYYCSDDGGNYVIGIDEVLMEFAEIVH